MERFTLTQPKNKVRETDYLQFLNRMYSGEKLPSNIWEQMTMQALREKGLCERDRGFVITEKGRKYVEYVNSVEKTDRKILREILAS
jgi:hypothetical protein